MKLGVDKNGDFRWESQLFTEKLLNDLYSYGQVEFLDDASHDDASHDDASHDDASHDDASHDDASHDDASHDDASRDTQRPVKLQKHVFNFPKTFD